MWIEFSHINIKLIILFIYPLFRRIEDYVKEGFLKNDHYLFKMFRYFSSHIFSLIFLLIMKKVNKKSIITNPLIKENNDIEAFQDINNETIMNEIDKFMQKTEKNKKIKSGIFLIFLCILSCWCYIYRLIFEKNEYEFAKQSIGIFFEISEFIILSYFILKQKLYLHNYVSIGLMSFTLLILFIISVFHIDNNYIISSFIYYIFYSIFFCLKDILIKKYMNDFYNSPYFLMFIVGAINVIALLIYDLFAYYMNRDVSGIIKGLQNNVNSLSNFFLFLLDLIIEFIWCLGIFLTIYYFNPCHFFISEYISEYIYYMKNAYCSDNKFYSSVNIIIFSIANFINIFCAIVFNEVLILNFCKLDFNTKKRIEERMNTDENYIKEDGLTFESEENND